MVVCSGFGFVNISFLCGDHFAAGLSRCGYTFVLSNLRILILFIYVVVWYFVDYANG